MKTIKSILAVALCAVGLAAFAKEHDLVVLNVDGSPATDGYYWNENAAISALVITNNELTVTGTSTTERVELRSAQKLTLRDLYIDLAANTNSGKTCLAPYNAAPVTVNIEGRVVMHTTSNAIYMHDGGTLTIGGSGEISMTVEKQYAAVYVGKGGGLVIADSVNLMARCTIARAFATDEDKGGTITISGSGRIDLRSESKAGIFAETETGKLTIAQTATNVIVRGFTPGEEGGYLPGETGALEFHVDDAVSLPSGWGILSSPDIDAADMPVAAEMKQVPEHDDGLNAYTCYIGEDFARAVTFGPVESLTLPAVLGATASVGGLAMPAGIVGVPAGKTSVVTWTAKAGYKITSGESESLVMDGSKTAQAPTVVHVGQGTEEDPWEAGKTADDSVVAWTNGVGGLVVEGAGAMKAFNGKTDPAPWGNTITEVEIGEDVTVLGANAFNGCDALTDVTLKATQPPVVGMNAFKGCDALETINVPLWSSGAYLHTDGWMDYTIVEPQTPQIWADGHRVAADKQVGVCSWTWHGDMETVLKEMQADGRYNGMQLALAPWLGIDSMSLYFGGKESTEMWEFIKEKIASGELNVMSTMINFPKEDYTTIQSITNTMGYMYGVADGASDAEEQWATNLFLTAEAARLSKELGVDTLTTEAGFICIDENLMFERMKEVCMTCAVHGVQILIESGPQTSLFLTNLLVNLEKEGYTNVGINFDPGDTQLFFSYDALNHETPTDSYAIMKPWIRMVHVKDCKLDRPAWNEDCVWGDGIVSQMDFNDWAKVGGDVERHFLEQLAAEGYTGNILYERLSGDETLTPARKEEITLAIDRIFAALPAPIVAESDEFTVDLRTRVELAEGETTVSNITWSATLWGELDEEFVTAIGWTNLTTGATGVFSNLAGVVGDAAEDANLPKKDGEYVLTHSTGDLKSFVTFVVSGYPLGSEGNPWLVGAGEDPDSVVAWKDGDGTVYFKPPRSAVSREGLETITNALGGTGFGIALVDADGAATNDVKMIIGAGGKQYTTLDDMLASDDDSFKFFDVTGCVVNYDGMGAAGEMKPDTFLPGVPTNLTANAYTAVGYTFQGWTTNVDTKVIFEDEAAIDDPQPGDIYDLKAKWNPAKVTATTHEQLTNALAAAAQQGAEMPVTINVSGTIDVPLGGMPIISGDPAKAMVTLAGSGTIDGFVENGGNLMVGGSIKVSVVLKEGAVIGVDPANLLKSGAKIHVTTEEGVTYDNPVKIAVGAKSGDEKYFVSDDEYAVYEDGAIVFHKKGDVNTPWTVGKDVKAYIDENGTLHIEGTGAMRDFTENEPAPWVGHCSQVKAIVVGTGVTKVGNAAFTELEFMDTTSTLSVVDDTHELNLLAFVEPDGSETNAPWTSQFRVVRDGTVESVAAFGPKGSTAFYGSVEEALTDGDTTSMLLLTLAETVQREKDCLTATAGEKPYSKQMQDIIDKAFAKLDDAEGYGDVVDVHQDYADQIEAQAAKDEPHAIEGTDITWRVMDGTVVIEGKGAMPDFVEPDYPDGAPWNERQTDITNVTVAAGITSVGDAAFAVCPAVGEASVLFKDPAIELNLGAFVSGDGSATNVPTVKVDIVTDDGRTLRVAPGGWTDADDPNTTYGSLAEAIENGVRAVTPAFEKKTDAGDVVVPPAEVEEIVTVTDGTGAKTELAAKFVNDANGLGLDREVGLVTEVENIAASVEALSSNIVVTVKLESSGTMDVALSNECESAKAGFAPDAATLGFVSHNFDIDVAWSYAGAGGELTELPASIVVHVPMKVYDGFVYSVSRLHGGAFEALPEWTAGTADSATAEWFKVDVANGEIVIKTRLFCPYAIGVLELEKTCSVSVGNGDKYVGDRDPVSLPTNFTLTVTGPYNLSEFAGYAKRAYGESAGDYAINFVCVKMPDGFPAAGFGVKPGVFTIAERPDRIEPTGKVTYAKATKGNILYPSKPATWSAKPGLGSRFAGWEWIGEGAEPAGFHKLYENERRLTTLKFTVGKKERIAPKDFAAKWVRIDEDLLTDVWLSATNRLTTDSRSYVSMTIKGVPAGLKFVAKRLAFGGTAKKNGRFKVTVSAKNSSGYTLKQTGYLVVAGKKVVGYEPITTKLTGVPLMLWCDTTMGSVSGCGVFASGSTRKVNAKAKTGYVFAGWFSDPGFSTPAKFKGGKDHRIASQALVLKKPNYLFARFLPKTTTADPIVWLRYEGAGYCGAPASFLDEKETWYQGVRLPTNGCQIAFGSASLPAVSVKGLPAGVTFDKKTLRFKGSPTRAGTFTVKVTVKNQSASTDVLTRKVVVKALPKWLVGTFDGISLGLDGEGALVENGITTVTVGSTGKISGKTVVKGKASAFKATSFTSVMLDGDDLVYVLGTRTFAQSAETGLGEYVYIVNGLERAWAVQRGWTRKDLALALPVFPTGTKALKLSETAEDGSVIKFTFGAYGVIKVAGKVPGKGGKLVSISGSCRVLPTGMNTVQDAPEKPERLAELLADTCVNIAPTKTLPAGFCAVEPLAFTVNSSNKVTAVADPSAD